jgi:hypothetical protein
LFELPFIRPNFKETNTAAAPDITSAIDVHTERVNPENSGFHKRIKAHTTPKPPLTAKLLHPEKPYVFKSNAAANALTDLNNVKKPIVRVSEIKDPFE